MKARILTGDMRETLKLLPDNSIDAIVTDPPYGLSFMNKGWDHSVPGVDYWKECLRVAKPGAHIVAFSGTRTGHRLACALEDAGWELRDCLAWIYGSGFPKSHNLTGTHKGWGTALKPAHEPIYLARKSAPIEEDLASQAELAREEVCKVVSFAQTGTPSFESLQTSGLLSTVSSLSDCLAGLSTHASMCTTETKSVMITDLRILRSYTSQLTRLITTKDPSQSAGLTSIAQTVAHLSSSVVAKCARLAPTTAGALAIDLRVESESVQAGAGREDIMFARKPFDGTVASNVLEHGTGAINVDGCRIGTEGGGTNCSNRDENGACRGHKNAGQSTSGETFHGPESTEPAGRWPANLCLDESAAAMLGDPARFFYVAKASRSEREKGCELHRSLLVKWTWANGDHEATLRVDTETSPPRVTAVSGAQCLDASAWSTLLFGSEATAPYLKACRFTTSTETSSTTHYRTLNWLARSYTNVSTVDASSETGSPTSPAASVGKATLSIDTTSATTVSLPGVGPAASGMLLRISESEPNARMSSHPTVKPIALMQWLIKLITPPGGIVLDPFNGSGSTGCAAVSLGFKYVGCELNPEYVGISYARMRAWAK